MLTVTQTCSGAAHVLCLFVLATGKRVHLLGTVAVQRMAALSESVLVGSGGQG